MIKLRQASAAAVALALLLAGCGGGGEAGDRSLRVSAAASLAGVFTELANAYEAEHPGMTVEINAAASSSLAQQVNDGAPVDVFASADEATMKRVTDAGNASDPTVFARNRLAILVTKGNPKRVGGLADLARPGVTFLMCASEVPCGRYGAAALQEAGVGARPASLEDNVKGVVAKVILGEADAGIVYETDVKAAGDKVERVGVDLAGGPALVATYVIAVTRQARNPGAARAWVDFVLSDRARQALARHGFLPP